MCEVSVIIPVYNVENYVKKCIDSVINQTYTNIEIILVDDGSTDSCGSICKEYSLRDNRILVIHKKNGGLSEARNVGLSYAKGNYILFVDGDDYIEKNMIEKLYNTILSNDSDMALCNFFYVDENEEVCGVSPEINTENLDKYSAQKMLFEEDKEVPYIVMWNKLFKKEILDDIRFPIGKIHEDEFVIHHIYDRCQSISVITDRLYYYVQRKGSIINQPISVKKLDYYEAFYDRFLFYEKKGYKDLLFIYKNYLNNRSWKRDLVKASNKLERKRVKDIDGMIKYMIKHSGAKLNFKDKIKLLVPNLYIRLHNVKG